MWWSNLPSLTDPPLADALHLQPIPHLYQLRPSLHYLDVAEALIRAKEEKTRKEKAGEDRDDDIDADVKGGKTEKVEEVQLSAVVVSWRSLLLLVNIMASMDATAY